MKLKLAKNYQLNNCGRYYTISNCEGKDVFYFKKSNINYGFPFYSNIKIDVFEDELLYYCERKMSQCCLSNEKFEFFLITYFNRILKHQAKLNLYKIDEHLLNKNGKLSITLLNYDLDRISSFAENLNLHLSINIPYSPNYNWWIFNTVQKMITYNYFERDSDVAELSREDFEKELNCDLLKMEYVEHYSHDNKFYFEFVKNEDNLPKAKIVFYMTTKEQVQLFFLKNEYH